MFENNLNGNRTLADLQTEVEDLTVRLGMAEELAELHATEKDAMAVRYDKVIAKMRTEVDEANALWDAHLAQWEGWPAKVGLETWYRKVILLSVVCVLALAIVMIAGA